MQLTKIIERKHGFASRSIKTGWSVAMYKRDFGILFIAICAIYLSLNNDGPFVLRKAWLVNDSTESIDIKTVVSLQAHFL